MDGRAGRNRTFVKGFGDLYSTAELRPYFLKTPLYFTLFFRISSLPDA